MKPYRHQILGLFRFSVTGFLAALVVLIMAAPFLAMFPNGQTVETSLLTLTLISAVMAVGHSRRVLGFAVLLMLPAVAGRWLHHFWPEIVSPVMFLISVIIFIGFIIFQLLRFILRAPRVDVEVLCAGISSYLLLGLLWAFAYMLVAWLIPGAFDLGSQAESANQMTSFISVYFSFVTLSTVGYGDIVPVAPVARMLASTEAMTGTLYVAILISRLVSLYSRQPSVKSDGEKPD